MKTSNIEVRDLLSVLTVDEVEERIGKVQGVASATVNYASGHATVRYDETLVEVADIKVILHQRGQQSSGGSKPEHESEDKPAHEHAAEPKPVPASASVPQSDAPKAAPVPVPAKPAPTPSAADVPEGKTAQGAAPAPAAAVSKA